MKTLGVLVVIQILVSSGRAHESGPSRRMISGRIPMEREVTSAALMNPEFGGVVCTGTPVSDLVILSVTSCIETKYQHYMYIRFGHYNLNEKFSDEGGYYFVRLYIFPSSNYIAQSSHREDYVDQLGIVVTSRRITFMPRCFFYSRLLNIHLPTNGTVGNIDPYYDIKRDEMIRYESDFRTGSSSVAGWGGNGISRHQSDCLQTATNVSFMSDTTCYLKFVKLGNKDLLWMIGQTEEKPVHFCAQRSDRNIVTPHKIGCLGDRGAPLMHDGNVYGLLTFHFAEHCGEVTHPDVFVNVTHYYNFIRRAMVDAEKKYKSYKTWRIKSLEPVTLGP